MEAATTAMTATAGGEGVAPAAATAAAAAALPPPAARTLGRQESTAAGAFDAWLAQKVRADWTSGELGALLTRERVREAVASFPQLENPVKVGHDSVANAIGGYME